MNLKISSKEDLFSFTARLDSKGRVSIPTIVRKKFDLETGRPVSLKIIKSSEVKHKYKEYIIRSDRYDKI